MPSKKKQQSKPHLPQGTNRNNRQSLTDSDPIDLTTRPINYRTEVEVKKLMQGAKASRNPDRDVLFILMLFRHGLRESEIRMIRRDSMKLDTAQIWIERVKGGRPSYHPIGGDELRLIRRYLRTRNDDLPWLFISEQKQPLCDRSTRVIVGNAAKVAGLPHTSPHMLRHSCGFYLHNKGHNSRLIQDYLGHVNPASTMIYTRTSAKQFQGLFN